MYCTIWLNITPKLHAKNATQAAHKISRGASRRGQFWASGVSRFLRAIWCNVGLNVNQIVQQFVPQQHEALGSTLVARAHCLFLLLLLTKLLRDKLLHDLVENYAEITPKLHAKNVTPPTPKIGRGAKRRGHFCAPPVLRFFASIFGVISA